jgi:hypothetical protein
VGHDDQGSSIGGQGALQVLDQGRGQVVGRFVQQHQVDRAVEQPGEVEAAQLAGRQLADRGVEVVMAEQAEERAAVRPAYREGLVRRP